MPNLNQVVNNLNRSITNKEIEIVRKSLPIKKVQDKVDSQHNFTKLSIANFLNLLNKREVYLLPNTFYESSVIPIFKLGNNTYKIKLLYNIPDEYSLTKNTQEDTCKQNMDGHQKDYLP